jgi:hypothetical protein
MESDHRSHFIKKKAEVAQAGKKIERKNSSSETSW